MTRHSNTDLVISAGNSHDITKIIGLIVDLDVFVQELFLEMTRKQLCYEGGEIHDLILQRSTAINGEFDLLGRLHKH